MRGLPMIQRLMLAAKALTGLFDPSSATAAQGLLTGIFRGTQGSYPERGTQELLNTFNTSPWARACSMRVADVLSATHWRLYVSTKNGQVVRNSALQKAPFGARQKLLKQALEDETAKEVTEHLLLDLLRDGNSEFQGPDLWWLHSVFMDLIGDAFYMKQRNALGKPESLFPVPPHWVVRTPTPSKPYYCVSYRAWVKEIPQTEMLWARNPNPVNPYWRGTGIAKALDDELELDEFAAKHLKSFFRNNARPDIVVMPKEGSSMGPTERDRLEQWWNDRLQGFWKSYKPLFMNVPMEMKVLEQNFQQMQFSELRSQEADIIMQVWGIPPELFGRLANSNRATITLALQIFGKSVLVPRLERLRHWLQANLVPEYDSPLILEYDSPVPEDREFSLSVMKAQPAAFALNEYRELANLQEDETLYDQYGTGPIASPQAPLENMTNEEVRQLYDLLDQAASRPTQKGARR